MAVNLSSYIKNLGKSVGYSAVDKVKKMNPTIENLVNANEDLTKDLYKNVKDYKSSFAFTKFSIVGFIFLTLSTAEYPTDFPKFLI